MRYDGMIHDFGLLNGLAEEPAVRSLFAHAAAELKHYLHEESGRRNCIQHNHHFSTREGRP